MLDWSGFNNPTNYNSLEEFIVQVVNMAISFSVIIAIIALIIAGFKYILAMGDEEKVEGATKSLIFALVGLVIVFLAPLLVEYITTLMQVE
jgi:type IV secretory pathway VirB2 component (pilin)